MQNERLKDACSGPTELLVSRDMRVTFAQKGVVRMGHLYSAAFLMWLLHKIILDVCTLYCMQTQLQRSLHG